MRCPSCGDTQEGVLVAPLVDVDSLRASIVCGPRRQMRVICLACVRSALREASNLTTCAEDGRA
ncbi:MAG: hypothetical protein IMZ55_11315 [Acidobacteria bacterium]|nr:hypothetical protein [Acidobacteriota bacterium]